MRAAFSYRRGKRKASEVRRYNAKPKQSESCSSWEIFFVCSLWTRFLTSSLSFRESVSEAIMEHIIVVRTPQFVEATLDVFTACPQNARYHQIVPRGRPWICEECWVSRGHNLMSGFWKSPMTGRVIIVIDSIMGKSLSHRHRKCPRRWWSFTITSSRNQTKACCCTAKLCSGQSHSFASPLVHGWFGCDYFRPSDLSTI